MRVDVGRADVCGVMRLDTPSPADDSAVVEILAMPEMTRGDGRADQIAAWQPVVATGRLLPLAGALSYIVSWRVPT